MATEAPENSPARAIDAAGPLAAIQPGAVVRYAARVAGSEAAALNPGVLIRASTVWSMPVVQFGHIDLPD